MRTIDRRAGWSRLTAALLGLTLMGTLAYAAPVTKTQVKQMARGFLARAFDHAGQTLSENIASIDKVEDDRTGASFFVVHLDPKGYVVVSPDDMLSPIIMFNADDTFDSLELDNQRVDFCLNDVATRLRNLQDYREANRTKDGNLPETTPGTGLWDKYENTDPEEVREGNTDFSADQIYVDHLMQSSWNQGPVNGVATYNYFSPQWEDPDSSVFKTTPASGPYACRYNGESGGPPGTKTSPEIQLGGTWYALPLPPPATWTAGDADNIVCGCTATAQAQVIRYWEFTEWTQVGATLPQNQANSVNVQSKIFLTSSDYRWTEYRFFIGGGTGRNGASTAGSLVTYDFTKMPLAPSNPTEEQARMIGSLVHDCGITNGMSYSPSGSSGNVGGYEWFGYASVSCDNGRGLLNAGLPLNVDVSTAFPYYNTMPHAIVGDGYALYPDSGTYYYHLNFGWGSIGTWYTTSWMQSNYTGAIPTTQYAPNDLSTITDKFTHVSGLAVNLTDDVSGNDSAATAWTSCVLSGRILDANGDGVEGATVTVEVLAGSTNNDIAVGTTVSATTNAMGIYAFVLPKTNVGNMNYRIQQPQKLRPDAVAPYTADEYYVFRDGVGSATTTLNNFTGQWNCDFTEKTIPVVATRRIYDVTSTAAKVRCMVVDDGGDTVDPGEFYLYCNTTKDPTSNAVGITVNAPTGTKADYTVSVTGLTANTVYHVRACAETGVYGKGYGGDIMFKTDE